ncbi:MAG: fumarylacetoacetate hydrolase family protein [Armatimonadota bacterium]|nr:fumarylacetoacetate hydrolase family protein [bacterium]MDW8321506.1 fumarylacetoacetate hydrolase family protein [Armatimonadota bacterium]
MKLVSYLKDGRGCIGAVVGDVVVDLNEAMVLLGNGSDSPGVLARDMVHLIEQGDNGLQLAQEVMHAYRRMAELEAEAVRALAYPLSEIQYLPPVPRPQKILAIGANYRAHCEESGMPLPQKPIVFVKVPSALIAHGEAIVYPRITQELDYEGELAVVIGKRARNVSEDEAMAYVVGYTIMNDVTARDLQRTEGQWSRAKGCDTFAPCGPWLVTADEIEDPQSLTIETRVNGELRQHSSTGDMIFPIPALLAHISEAMTLLPGDIITTGTPAGVGVYRQPKGLLQPGDEVAIRIEGIGELRNRVVACQS